MGLCWWNWTSKMITTARPASTINGIDRPLNPLIKYQWKCLNITRNLLIKYRWKYFSCLTMFEHHNENAPHLSSIAMTNQSNTTFVIAFSFICFQFFVKHYLKQFFSDLTFTFISSSESHISFTVWKIPTKLRKICFPEKSTILCTSFALKGFSFEIPLYCKMMPM